MKFGKEIRASALSRTFVRVDVVLAAEACRWITFSLYATVAFLSLAMGFASSSEGPYWATTIEISGDQVGAACGILNTGGNLGGLLAPVLTPMIAAKFGWAGGLYFASFLVTIGMLTWLMVDPARKISTAMPTRPA